MTATTAEAVKAVIERLEAVLDIEDDENHLVQWAQSAADLLAKLLTERDEARATVGLLRGALIEIGRFVGGGLADNVSSEFLLNVPTELKLYLVAQDDAREAAEAKVEELRLEPILTEFQQTELLSRALKPEEIVVGASDRERRVAELVRWFRRYLDGNANPKWRDMHIAELAYYIASARRALHPETSNDG